MPNLLSIVSSRSWGARLARMLFMFVVLGTLAAMLFENTLIYHPSKDGEYEGNHGFPVQFVDFRSGDGVRLHGAYCPVENARGLILWCHGNGGNLSYGFDVAGNFRKLGVSVFLFDYRGYGRSEGSPDSKGVMLDAEAAYRYVTSKLKVPASHVVLLGESLGGAPAIYLASRHECGALITQSTFTSIRDMAGVMYPYFPWLRFFVRTDFPNLDTIAGVRAPKLLIHSRTDEVVPFWMGQKLFNAAAQPKEFWVIEHARHNDTFDIDGYTDRIGALLDRVLPAS
jgi:fermentation-respiration switch protein FrsA (DUF1100 family)